MNDAFNGENDEINRTPDQSEDGTSDMPLPEIRRIRASDRKASVERVDSLFDDTPGIDASKVESSPSPGRSKRSRTEKRQERRARRDHRASKIEPHQRMSGSDAEPRGHARRKSNNTWRHNLIALVFVLATIIFLAYFALLWVNPQSELNLFPPPTPLPVFVTATPDSALNTPVIDLRFVADAEISYRANTSCEYAGIAGNVETDDRERATYAVRISGNGIDSGVFSGSMLEYGTGGFEFQIADIPVTERFTVQLFTLDEIPVSEPVEVLTRATCEENIAFILFREVN